MVTVIFVHGISLRSVDYKVYFLLQPNPGSPELLNLGCRDAILPLGRRLGRDSG